MKKVCNVCKQNKKLEEYSQRKSGSYYKYCKQCDSERKIKRSKELKKEAVAYKGGCCEICGYCKNYSALQFHHKNPSQKDFWISRRSCSLEKVKTELDKCLLVCANCHAELHNPYLEVVA